MLAFGKFVTYFRLSLSQRLVYDNLKGVDTAVYSISKEMEKHCLLANVRCKDAQNQKKALSLENTQSLKRKLKREKNSQC